MIEPTPELLKAVERFCMNHPDFRKFEYALADFCSTRPPLPGERVDEYLERMLSQLVIH